MRIAGAARDLRHRTVHAPILQIETEAQRGLLHFPKSTVTIQRNQVSIQALTHDPELLSSHHLPICPSFQAGKATSQPEGA